MALGGGASLYQYLSQHARRSVTPHEPCCINWVSVEGGKDGNRDLLKLLHDAGQVKKLEDLVRVLHKQGDHKAAARVQAAADEWAEQAAAEKLQFKALLDQQETKKDALVKDFGNRIRQQQKRNADLKQGSGKRDEECKVLKRAFEQHKAEASNKLKAKQQVISKLKQEAHALGTAMEQMVHQLQEENRCLRHNLEVQEAAERSVASKLRCQVAACQQKFERQAAQNSSCLSEANAELQAREVRHNSKVGELDGEVRGLQQPCRQPWMLVLRQANCASRQRRRCALLRATPCWQPSRRCSIVVDDKGDELERVAGAKERTDGNLQRSDSQLQQANTRIQALEITVEEKDISVKEAKAEAAKANGARRKSDKALLEKQESLDKKVKVVGALQNSCAQLKGEKNALESQVHVLTAARDSAPRQSVFKARKRSKGASSNTSSAQVEMSEAQLSLGSSEASPEDSKTTAVEIGASPGAKGASLDTSEAAASSSALSPDAATASSGWGDSEGEGWIDVQSPRRPHRTTTNTGSSSRSMYHSSSTKSAR
ncbi:hypothetical protein WJX82_004147 [Trebouxia sp. C0006]